MLVGEGAILESRLDLQVADGIGFVEGVSNGGAGSGRGQATPAAVPVT